MVVDADEGVAVLLAVDGVCRWVEREQRSPGKYICVTSRCVNDDPNTEKWMWGGRHALRLVLPRVGPGLIS